MKGFYDKILVDYANKYAKKWGANVTDTKLPSGKTVHAIDITPGMKSDILNKGQPLFALTGAAGAGAAVAASKRKQSDE